MWNHLRPDAIYFSRSQILCYVLFKSVHDIVINTSERHCIISYTLSNFTQFIAIFTDNNNNNNNNNNILEVLTTVMTTITISWAVPPCSLLHTVCKVRLCQTPVQNSVKNTKLFMSQRGRKQTAGFAHKSAHLSKLCEWWLVYLAVHIQVHFVQSPCSVVQYYVPPSYNLILKDAGFLAP
jgi:hypothetical protein